MLNCPFPVWACSSWKWLLLLQYSDLQPTDADSAALSTWTPPAASFDLLVKLHRAAGRTVQRVHAYVHLVIYLAIYSTFFLKGKNVNQYPRQLFTFNQLPLEKPNCLMKIVTKWYTFNCSVLFFFAEQLAYVSDFHTQPIHIYSFFSLDRSPNFNKLYNQSISLMDRS